MMMMRRSSMKRLKRLSSLILPNRSHSALMIATGSAPGSVVIKSTRINPEEISRNFVLRVLAARSPNIKLRKALSGERSRWSETNGSSIIRWSETNGSSRS